MRQELIWKQEEAKWRRFDEGKRAVYFNVLGWNDGNLWKSVLGDRAGVEELRLAKTEPGVVSSQVDVKSWPLNLNSLNHRA